MKKYPGGSYVCTPGFKALFFIFISILAFAGCKKETVTNTSISTLSSANLVTDTAIKFGANINETLVNDNMTVFNLLGVKYIRYQIILKEFKGTDSRYQTYIDNGYKIILNINYGNPQRGAVPFPTDMVAYKSLLESVLNVYKPEIAVIENEPTTAQFHSGPIENYITELKTAVSVCNAKGVKVADGAMGVQLVQMAMNGQGFDKVAQTKKLIEAYKTISLDYVNIH